MQVLWASRCDATFRSEVPIAEITNRAWSRSQKQIAALSCAQRHLHLGEPFGFMATAMAVHTESATRPKRWVRLQFDGGSRGNPGTAGAGWVLYERDAQARWRVAWFGQVYVGDRESNNVAELTGLRDGLQAAQENYNPSDTYLQVRGDSKLVMNLLSHQARPHTQLIQHRLEPILKFLYHFRHYECQHVLRTGNKVADYLANAAMDQHLTWRGSLLDHLSYLSDLTTHSTNDLAHSISIDEPPNLRHSLERSLQHSGGHLHIHGTFPTARKRRKLSVFPK